MKTSSRTSIQGMVARMYAYEIYELPHKCEICGKVGRTEVHHIDRNRDNNERNNLKILCRADHNRCHSMIKEIKNITLTEIITFYYKPGVTLKNTGKHFGVSSSYISGRLEDAGYKRKKQGSYVRHNKNNNAQTI